jgi:hypothetical protein
VACPDNSIDDELHQCPQLSREIREFARSGDYYLELRNDVERDWRGNVVLTHVFEPPMDFSNIAAISLQMAGVSSTGFADLRFEAKNSIGQLIRLDDRIEQTLGSDAVIIFCFCFVICSLICIPPYFIFLSQSSHYCCCRSGNNFDSN